MFTFTHHIQLTATRRTVCGEVDEVWCRRLGYMFELRNDCLPLINLEGVGGQPLGTEPCICELCSPVLVNVFAIRAVLVLNLLVAHKV